MKKRKRFLKNKDNLNNVSKITTRSVRESK